MNSILVPSPLAIPAKGKARTADSNLKLQVTPTTIAEILILEPKVFGDNRSWFIESFYTNNFAKATGLVQTFKITDPYLGSGRNGACITSSSIPKAS
jgi:hypothetical protein